MDRTYITAHEFRDFTKNQDTLIAILNHSVTKLSTDVTWLKILAGWQVGLIGTIGVTILIGFCKLVFF